MSSVLGMFKVKMLIQAVLFGFALCILYVHTQCVFNVFLPVSPDYGPVRVLMAEFKVPPTSLVRYLPSRWGFVERT
jgi:hypothetical protein